jgi:hypothetical protein
MRICPAALLPVRCPCPPRFRIGDTYQHDISLSSFEQGSVISEGSGLDLNIDFHRSVPYGNLVTNVFFGNATRPFIGSGGQTVCNLLCIISIQHLL